jgi:GTP-binding protein
VALPIVAIVGRPNVGKSTLTNRLAGTHDAIVFETPGVTRDRSYHRADWNGREFVLIDTGGIDFSDVDAFGASIRQQALMAAEEADVVVFMVDGHVGIAPGDEEVAQILKKSGKPAFLIVNKLDNPAAEEAIHDFWPLGLGEPHAVSALHGHGTGDLLDELVAALPESDEVPQTEDVNVAIIGRPNAGKSSLFNRLVGAERSIVSEVAGTTRDALDTVVERDGTTYRLVDTAGLRRQGKIEENIEYYSFVRAMRAIDRADVALLVVDTSVGVTDQDQRVAAFAEERGCALGVLLNKWDLLQDEEAREKLLDQIPRQLGFVRYAPVLRISALTGRGTDRIYQLIDTVYASYTRKITTSALNKLLTELRNFGHTVTKGPRQLRLNYATQTRQKPPGFVFFANHPRLADENFKRYLENRMRETFDFTGTPIILKFRQKD